MNTRNAVICDAVVEAIPAYLEGSLPPGEAAAFDRHMKACEACAKELEEHQQVLSLVARAYSNKKISAGFDQAADQKLVTLRQTGKHVASQGDDKDGAFLAEQAFERAGQGTLFASLSAAPWWGVSVALHVLVILLAGLISMSIELPKPEDGVVVITELQPKTQIAAAEEVKEKQQEKSALASKHETPPTDPTSKEMSDIVVPPDILAKAELGDHFETINPDRPDTHSAFGNPDSHFFYSEKGNDEPEGGGGMGGSSLDDLIGVGGAASPGSGGGWGGGHGTGIGVGNGSGRGSFGNRNGGGRRLMVKRHGGSPATESSVDKALEWLARHQEADGRWSVKNTEGLGEGKSIDWDPGVTGLAVLAFLGAGHTEKVGKYQDNVRRAIYWIISQQRADGAIGTDAKWTEHHGGYGYHHAICGLALAEAAGMGRVPDTKAAAQKAIDYTSDKYQHGEGSDKLGWRYEPKAAVADVSVSGWYVMQLKSAKIAGLKVDHFSFEGALKFLETREQKPEAVKKEDEGYDNGRHRYGYTERGAMVNTTAIGILCQLFCGVKADEVRGAAMWLLRTNPPAWKADLGVANAGGWPMYYTYYTTLVMFQMGGDLWKQWNEGMKKMLVDNQRRDGDASGSWDPLSNWEKNAGRAYTTALGALSLEVYYRYAKLGER